MKKNLTIKVAALAAFALMTSAFAETIPATDSGTYFVAKGKKLVNEELVRVGSSKNGSVNFSGFASFDLTGLTSAQLQGATFSVSCDVASFAGSPATLTVDYMGTFPDGDFNVESGTAWSVNAVANLSSGPVSAGSFTSGATTLPLNSFLNKFAVFRFTNSTKATQWDITNLVLTVVPGGSGN